VQRDTARALLKTGLFVCVGAFALGTLGSNDCPANYFHIVAANVCQSAAAANGQAYQGKTTDAYSPRGCYSLSSGVFFNTDATGAGRPSSKLICSGAHISIRTPRAFSLVVSRGRPALQLVTRSIIR
jgi:hypothetical protein